MLKESSTVSINVREGVLNLPNCSQDPGDRVKTFCSQITDVVFLDVSLSKALQMQEAGISVSEHSMPITRDYSSLRKSLSDILLNDLAVRLLTSVVILELDQPLEALLICETMEGSSKSVHSSRIREVGIGKS